MDQGYFITGIDTGVGKTCVTIALMQHLKQQGNTVAGMKPVASGCLWHEGQLKNSDALLIQQHCSSALAYGLINPYAYELAISPHLAGVDHPAQLPQIKTCLAQLKSAADFVVVEGAGGWYSPLAIQMDNADLAIALNFPVILVVAIRMGCINHARLTRQAIRQSGAACKGWFAMCVDPEMLAVEANIDFLRANLDLPLLGVLPFSKQIDFDKFSKFITMK